MYDDYKHVCVEGDHIVNIFSFSKAYGMMGWRVGYVRNILLSLISFFLGFSFSSYWSQNVLELLSYQYPNSMNL